MSRLQTLTLLTLICLFQATPSMAMPVLSPDGSLLSGLIVEGYGVYDVSIGDSLTGALFSGITFDAGRAAEANAVSFALATALQSLGVAPDDVAGCSDAASCGIFIPDQQVFPFFDPDSSVLWFLDAGPASTDQFFSPDEWTSGSSIEFFRHPAFDSATSPYDTNGWYERRSTAVPVPTSILLIVLGLALLAARKVVQTR